MIWIKYAWLSQTIRHVHRKARSVNVMRVFEIQIAKRAFVRFCSYTTISISIMVIFRLQQENSWWLFNKYDYHQFGKISSSNSQFAFLSSPSFQSDYDLIIQFIIIRFPSTRLGHGGTHVCMQNKHHESQCSQPVHNVMKCCSVRYFNKIFSNSTNFSFVRLDSSDKKLKQYETISFEMTLKCPSQEKTQTSSIIKSNVHRGHGDAC